MNPGEFNALEKGGPGSRVGPDLLDLARTYYLTNSSLTQIHRLTGISRNTLEYHAYRKADCWRSVKDRIDRLRTKNIASVIAKVASDYAETLVLSAERMLEDVKAERVTLTVQEQKQLSDAIGQAFRNQIEREKLNLAIAQANNQQYEGEDDGITEAEAIEVLESDPAATATFKREDMEVRTSEQEREDSDKHGGSSSGGPENADALHRPESDVEVKDVPSDSDGDLPT